MRTFSHRKDPDHKASPARSRPARSKLDQGRGLSSSLHFLSAAGNQAVQRMASQRRTANGSAPSGRLPDAPHGASPLRHSRGGTAQAKLKVGARGDKHERQADRVAARVVQQSDRPEGGVADIRRRGGADHERAMIPRGSDLGKPLDARTRREMGRKLGFDLSGVRVHTADPAVYLSRRLNARAFTYGSDIFFNKGEYNPQSRSGKRLLAHELTHVVQQSGMSDRPARRGMIQRTTIGEILDEFFSPFSSETLWVMGENDNYTKIVRTWQPVIDAVNQAKADLTANCATWSANHMTDSKWTPGRTDPPVTDPNAHGIWVASPPGTDPKTCRDAFITYVSTKAVPLVPTVQTFELYTCSIGSFGIYATVDTIDCAAKTATMKVWMYNAMDQGSFGSYASHPAFALSGMERQYMWWNWKENLSWGPAKPGGGGPKGGSSDW